MATAFSAGGTGACTTAGTAAMTTPGKFAILDTGNEGKTVVVANVIFKTPGSVASTFVGNGWSGIGAAAASFSSRQEALPAGGGVLDESCSQNFASAAGTFSAASARCCTVGSGGTCSAVGASSAASAPYRVLTAPTRPARTYATVPAGFFDSADLGGGLTGESAAVGGAALAAATALFCALAWAWIVAHGARSPFCMSSSFSLLFPLARTAPTGTRLGGGAGSFSIRRLFATACFGFLGFLGFLGYYIDEAPQPISEKWHSSRLQRLGGTMGAFLLFREKAWACFLVLLCLFVALPGVVGNHVPCTPGFACSSCDGNDLGAGRRGCTTTLTCVSCSPGRFAGSMGYCGSCDACAAVR
jgi:hypothetical protein